MIVHDDNDNNNELNFHFSLFVSQCGKKGKKMNSLILMMMMEVWSIKENEWMTKKKEKF